MGVTYDFSGYATKANLKCSDGRTILPGAFKHQDGTKVPLVWQHVHDDPTNTLGHAVLEHRDDGMYAYCSFNATPKAKHAKELVAHGDIVAMSIYANRLREQNLVVQHGDIKEVSLVLAAANPGASIDNITIAHGDGTHTDLPDEAVIYTGLELRHADAEPETKDTPASEEKTVKQIFDSMTPEQQRVCYAMAGAAMAQSGELKQSDEGGENFVKENVFDNDTTKGSEKHVLTHADFVAINEEAKKSGSFREAFFAHANSLGYGIDNIEILFPDARNVTPTPDMIQRDTAWVSKVLNGAKHSPFSRIKTTIADITADDARAKGYITGNYKKEEVVRLMKRKIGPTTLYKKQKLDRDDIVDITDMDVVAWIKAEMRVMLDEELARAVLLGDGREVDDEDKIDESCILPIYKDDDLYAHHVILPADVDTEELIDEIVRSHKFYKGSGNPHMFTTTDLVTDMMLLKDGFSRRMYGTETELAAALRVSGFTEVPVMENTFRETDDGEVLELLAILVNMADYTIGADRGGSVTMFDDFDIDYNQYKYLLETRCSGMLIHPKRAIIIERKVDNDLDAVKIIAPNPYATYKGLKARDAQSGISIGSDNIRGKLNYIEFPEKDGEMGNVLILQVANLPAEATATIDVTPEIGMTGETASPSVDVDGKQYFIVAIGDPKKQKVTIKLAKGGKNVSKTYHLRYLECETEESQGSRKDIIG